MPIAIADVVTRLFDITFSFRDLPPRYVERHWLLQNVVGGGGAALVVGSVVAAATEVLAYPQLALLTIAAATYGGWRGVRDSKALAMEISA